jgi:hypothetical protein
MGKGPPQTKLETRKREPRRETAKTKTKRTKLEDDDGRATIKQNRGGRRKET